MTGAFDSAIACMFGRLRRVREVDHDADAVQLGDDLLAEGAQAVVQPTRPLASPVFESASWLWPLCASDR